MPILRTAAFCACLYGTILSAHATDKDAAALSLTDPFAADRAANAAKNRVRERPVTKAAKPVAPSTKADASNPKVTEANATTPAATPAAAAPQTPPASNAAPTAIAGPTATPTPPPSNSNVTTGALPTPSPASSPLPAATTKPTTQPQEAKKKPAIPAKQLFGAASTPAPLAARSLGWYAKGCLSGAKPLEVDGPSWQVMRLSRNRRWGHPDLIEILHRLGQEAKSANEWPGLLVGDISQPRGGPMLTGHASHQVGLDADIWLTPMPNRRLTETEREDLSATSMLAADVVSVNPKVFDERQIKLIKRAASYARVERVLVHPAIKKALCEKPGDGDRSWLQKVRPYFGHYYHFHIRIGCPAGSANCQAQPPIPDGDSCGTELADWIKRITPKPKTAETPPAEKPVKPPVKKPDIMLADLPAECKEVLTAGGNIPPTEAIAADLSKDAAPPTDAPADALTTATVNAMPDQ